MKNMFKYGYSLLAGAAVLTAVSCSDKYEYEGRGTWNAEADYANIYFQETDEDVELDPSDPTTYTIKVGRRVEHSYTYALDSLGNPTDSIVGDEIQTDLPALTVPVEIVKNTDDVYNVGSLTFAEGDTLGTITVSFDNAVVGTPYQLQLTLTDPALVSKWSAGIIYNLKLTRVKWNTVGFYYDEDGNKVEGKANFTDDMLGGLFGVPPVDFPVVVQERDDRKGYFRIKNVYGEDYPYNEPGDWDDTKDYYMFIDATDPTKVFVVGESNEMGIDYGYGPISYYHLAGRYLAWAEEYEAEGDAENAKKYSDAAKDYYGTYANGKITFPAESFRVQMLEYSATSAWKANTNGALQVVINPDLDLYTAKVEDYDWEEVFSGTYMSAQLGKNTPQIKLYKGVQKDSLEEANPGAYKRFEDEYGQVYKIGSPYATGYDLVFAVKDGEVVVPEDYERQPLGFSGVGYDIYGTIGGGGSTFSDDRVDLKITFSDKTGKVDMGTNVESLVNITFTKDMVLGTFNYYATIGTSTYNLGAFTISENLLNGENALVLNDFYLDDSEVAAEVDLNAGKLFVADMEFLGIEEDEGTPYYIFTYNKGDDDRGAGFDINIDGTLTTDELILVGSPDMESLYYWVNASETTFVPTSDAFSKRASAFKGCKKGAKLNASLTAKERAKLQQAAAKVRQ